MITVRAPARQPIDVAIALDVSSSVRGERLERLRQARRRARRPAHAAGSGRRSSRFHDHQTDAGSRRDVSPPALDARLAAIVAGGSTSPHSRGDDGARLGRRPRAADAHPRVQRRARHVELDLRRPGAGAGAVERRRCRRRGRHRRAAADEHHTHRFRRPPRLTDAGRAVPRRSGRADWRTRPATARQGPAGLAGAFRDALEQFRGRYEIIYTATSKEPGWQRHPRRIFCRPQRSRPARLSAVKSDPHCHHADPRSAGRPRCADAGGAHAIP